MDPESNDVTPPSIKEKCRYCTADLLPRAKVCTTCNRYKCCLFNQFRGGDLSIGIALVMMGFAYYQVQLSSENLEETRQKRVEATAALERVEKAEITIARLQKDGEAALLDLRSNMDFNMLVTKATNDDRTAFNILVEIAQKPGPLYDIAKIVIAQIANNLVNPEFVKYTSPWEKYNIDPKNLTLQGFKNLYKRVLPVHKRAYIDLLMEQERFSMFDRLQILAEIIRNTMSLQELERACRKMDSEAKIKENILSVNKYLQWWEENKSRYESAAK